MPILVVLTTPSCYCHRIYVIKYFLQLGAKFETNPVPICEVLMALVLHLSRVLAPFWFKGFGVILGSKCQQDVSIHKEIFSEIQDGGRRHLVFIQI